MPIMLCLSEDQRPRGGYISERRNRSRPAFAADRLPAVSPIRRTVRTLVVLLLFSAPMPVQTTAQASAYVPNLDPVYADVDVLFAVGLVNVPSMGQRPYSRMAFGRLAAQARAAVRGSEEDRARVLEALDRLEIRFAHEMSLLCPRSDDVCDRPDPSFAIRSAAVDFTSSDSPGRPIRASYDWGFIGGEINPLLVRNQGRVLADGRTVSVEATMDIQLFPRVAVQLRPRLWHARPTGTSNDTRSTLQDAYVRGVVGGVALEVGRNHVAKGHGRLAGPMISHNARGLDMVRVSHDRPERLPWIFGALGSFTGAAWVADLGGDRRIPHGKLVVFEASLRPSRSVEIGVSLLNNQGGEGAPLAPLKDRLKDIVFPLSEVYSSDRTEISDKVVMGDVRVTIPSAGLEFYVAGLSTDLVINYREAYWADAAWTFGMKAVGRGREGRVDLWFEGHVAGIRAHTHHQLYDGLTVDRRLLGDALGPLATSLQAGLDWRAPADLVSFVGTYEVYSGDDWSFRSDDFPWMRTADNPDEIRLRTVVDWTRDHANSDLRTSVRLGYEHVNRFNFRDQNRSNYLAQIRVEWLPN